MILTIDIGNTALKMGVFDDVAGLTCYRWMWAEWDATDPLQALAELPIRRAGLIGVVPSRIPVVQERVRAIWGVEVEVFRTNTPMPLGMGYATPETLGMDRLVAALAGWTLYGESGKGLVVVDAGTAGNVEVVDAAGTYCGGAIAPGTKLMTQALARGTAQLPEIQPVFPEVAIGNSTQTCLQSGIMFMLADGLAGMIRRFRQELGTDVVVVATGGWGEMLRHELPEIQHHDAFLVLRGLRILMETETIT